MWLCKLNFNHVAEASRLHVASRALPSPNIFSKESEFEQIFTIVFLQFKTGVRMPLTSQIKELGAILQKLINLDKIQNENETNEMASLAMRMSLNFLTKSKGLGSVQQRKRKRICVLTRTRQMRKVVLNSVG